jgi:DNA repair protein SbcD/Mre11
LDLLTRGALSATRNCTGHQEILTWRAERQFVGALPYGLNMRLLHTSDWHLGRTLHGVDLLPHQAEFADHLICVAKAEAVDAVVVSGDIFDRATPPLDAVALADEILARLASSGIRTVLSSGNHDSSIRLGFGSRLADAAGIHLRTRADDVGSPVLFETPSGLAAIYAVPFLDPVGLSVPWQLSQPTHEAALRTAMHRIRSDLSSRRCLSVVMAHAFVAGGQPSDSERDISVGGVDRVPVDTFAGVDYVALGHLHGPRQLDRQMAYSGSPLAFSFSEVQHIKGTWLVNFTPQGHLKQDFIPTPVARRLDRISGSLTDLLQSTRFDNLSESWLEVTLTDPENPPHAIEHLRRRFPHLLSLRHQPPTLLQSGVPYPKQDPSRPDGQLALDFVAAVRGTPATINEAKHLQSAFDVCCHEDAL